MKQNHIYSTLHLKTRMLARLNMLMLLAPLLLSPTACDLLLNTVFLINSVKFNPAQYEQILSRSFGPATLLSVQSETPTGAEVRNLYFPDHTEVRLFQLVHITRVQAAIVTANETNTTYHLTRRLSEFCRDTIAPVVIVSSGAGGSAGFDLLSQIPPLVAPVAIGVWITTVAACGVCWACICCCKTGRSKPPPAIETAVELPTPVDGIPETKPPEPPPAPPAEPPTVKTQSPIMQPAAKTNVKNQPPQPPTVKTQPPIETPTNKPPPPPTTSGSAATIDLTPGIILNHKHCLSLMRLPPGLESADQYDLYEAPTRPGGPAAVRLESWPEASDS